MGYSVTGVSASLALPRRDANVAHMATEIIAALSWLIVVDS